MNLLSFSKMDTTIYVLYVTDTSVKVPDNLKIHDTGFPPLFFPIIGLNKYPVVWIGKTLYDEIESVIYDKRSCYTKFKNQTRYWKDYMELFRYVELNQNGSNLVVGIHKLESTDDSDKSNDLLMKHFKNYRLYYGNTLVSMDQDSKRLIENIVNSSQIKVLPKSKMVFEPDIPLEDRRRITRKNYEKNHREQRIEKNKKYYEEHKEELKQKRLEKAALENAAQVVEP